MILSDLEQQVLKYLDGRKTAATIKQIAKVLIRSDSHVKSLLLLMNEKGLIKSARIGSTKLYSKK
jgi:predicted transcriptional regulator